jgi:hypothetical protein
MGTSNAGPQVREEIAMNPTITTVISPIPNAMRRPNRLRLSGQLSEEALEFAEGLFSRSFTNQFRP